MRFDVVEVRLDSKGLLQTRRRTGHSLKVPYARPCLLKYYFGVGAKETCPLECDFSTTAIDNRSGTVLGIDWLLEMDRDSSIIVSVEMLAPPSDNLEDAKIHRKQHAI